MSNKDIMEYDFDEAEKEYAEGNAPEINRPYNPDMVDIISQPITIHSILDRIENNEIDLTPAFQRKDGLWNQTQKSRLIESILIKIPLPVFYFDSRDDDNWIIVDGLQRISTLNDFVLKKNFRLSNLEYLTQYKNLSYDELPRPMQRRIQECQLLTYCIRKGTPDNITISIFKRINTGGMTLNMAEIRNCVFKGIAADLVRNMANKESFKSATRNKISPDRMDDRELATRFTAFYTQGYKSYDGNIDLFLDKGLKNIKENYTLEKAEELLIIFDKTMTCCKKLFDDCAFRKKIKNKELYGPFNKSLFECVSCSIAELTSEEQELLVANKKDFFTAYEKLFDTTFVDAITNATGSIEHVKIRHTQMNELLKQKLQEYK